jgi:hypothetical protein
MSQAIAEKNRWSYRRPGKTLADLAGILAFATVVAIVSL